MPRKADHTRIPSLQKRWRKKQIHKVSEHVEKRVERKIKENSINGRGRKIPSEKNRCVKYYIHMEHNVPLESINTNWTMKHVSINGQIVVKTVQSGNLNYIKYQDVEAEVEEQMQKWQTKKLIATTVSSREKGIKRREEGETTSSQRMISLQGNQEESRNNLTNTHKKQQK